MLSDAELLLGLGRHLSAFTVSSAHAALESLQFGGQVYEMAWRLRSSQVSTATRVKAIGVDAHIGPMQLQRYVLPTMEQLGWVECHWTPERVLVSLEALVPPDRQLVNDTDRLLDILFATPVQRAALELLRSTSRQPLAVEDALDSAAAHGDAAAEEAMRHLTSVGLLRRVETVVDRPVVFNPNIWSGSDQVLSKAALRAQDAHASTEVGALIEEVAALPGIPEKHVRATEQKWIDFAVSQGLVERAVVQTSGGVEEGFLFSPHLKRDPFGAGPSDTSGHVRQMVGSMIYATTFASWKLRNPGGFLYTLLRDGEAGNVPNIATDYPMLETAGIIRVAPGTWGKAARMVLLQADVAESALDVLDARGVSRGVAVNLGTLGDQRGYSHLERERALMATTATSTDHETAQLIAALRDEMAGGTFRV